MKCPEKFLWDYSIKWMRCFIIKLNKNVFLMIAQISKLAFFYCTQTYTNTKTVIFNAKAKIIDLIIRWAYNSIFQPIRLFPSHFGDNFFVIPLLLSHRAFIYLFCISIHQMSLWIFRTVKFQSFASWKVAAFFFFHFCL